MTADSEIDMDKSMSTTEAVYRLQKQKKLLVVEEVWAKRYQLH